MEIDKTKQKASRAKAVDKLKLSHLATKRQMELMGGDVDLEDFTLQMRNHAGIRLVEAITEAEVTRTIEGASVLVVTVDDTHKEVQLSGRLGRRVDVNVNGLWFTLVQLKKIGTNLILTFEEREVNLMRYYSKFIMASRDTSTRAEFALRMIREVKETPLQWIIPELHVEQPIADVSQPDQVLVDTVGTPLPSTDDQIITSTNRDQGIDPKYPGLTAKGDPATPEQIRNADAVLTQGVKMHVTRKVLVCSIMTCITESVLINLVGGHADSVGLFQQRASQGWAASRDIAVDAADFFEHAKIVDKNYPNISYNDLCQKVQNSGTPYAYGQYQSEADEYVKAFGVGPPPGNDVTSINNQQDPSNSTIPGTGGKAGLGGSEGDAALALGGNYYTRGTLSMKGTSYILTKENTWNALQRLAGEVQWRCFVVSGVVYFISEKWLFKSKPFMTISESTPGVDFIDFDYDEGKKSATVTVTCHLGRWSAPPGSVVLIRNEGVINGRWLVNDVTRSLYNTDGTITLKKPLPILPEPTTLVQLPSGFTGPGEVPPGGGGRGSQDAFHTTGNLTQPVPKASLTGLGVIHETSGLPGFPATDFMAPAGSPAIAVEHGTIQRLSGRSPSLGPSSGVHGPFGFSIYLNGQSGAVYYYTHMGSQLVSSGEEVVKGQQIGDVGDYARWGGADHIHLGVSPGPGGHPDIHDIRNAQAAT